MSMPMMGGMGGPPMGGGGMPPGLMGGGPPPQGPPQGPPQAPQKAPPAKKKTSAAGAKNKALAALLSKGGGKK